MEIYLDSADKREITRWLSEGIIDGVTTNPTILFNMHHFNVTDHDILKENWANLWWEDDDAKTRVSWWSGGRWRM